MQAGEQTKHSSAIKQIGYMRDTYAPCNTDTQRYTSVVPSDKYCMSTGINVLFDLTSLNECAQLVAVTEAAMLRLDC